MASSSNTSNSDDQQQHYADKEAAQKKQNGKELSSSWSSSKEMKYTAFVVLVIILVMSAAMGFIWATVKPKRPVYAIEYAHIEAGTFNQPEFTSVTGNFSFVMRAYNPNKKSTIYYESMNIFFNTTDRRNEAPIPVGNFFQPPFNVTRIHFSVWTTFSSDDGAHILNDTLLHGRITANISVQAVMRFRYRSWKSMPHAIGIYCQPAAILLRNNFQPTDCFVDL